MEVFMEVISGESLNFYSNVLVVNPCRNSDWPILSYASRVLNPFWACAVVLHRISKKIVRLSRSIQITMNSTKSLIIQQVMSPASTLVTTI